MRAFLTLILAIFLEFSPSLQARAEEPSSASSCVVETIRRSTYESVQDLSGRIIREAKDAPVSASYNTLIAVDEHFAPIISDVRKVMDVMLLNVDDITAQTERMEMSNTVARVTMTHNKIQSLAKPSVDRPDFFVPPTMLTIS